MMTIANPENAPILVLDTPDLVWRRKFAEEIMGLADGEADMLQVADWAVLPYTTESERNAIEVAREELEHFWPLVPD
jgi:hypothetical protein